MSRGGGTTTKKDVLLELVSRDIKELQRVHSEGTGDEARLFTEGEEQVQLLCDHLDHILMHGLREFEEGYWPFVRYFTRSELVQRISRLRRVTTNIGKGRSWLYTALNEQSVESYVRMFTENQDVVEGFYLRDAFIRDMEHLLLLLTLVSGLDFISFNLQEDCDYLDYGASRLSAQITSITSTTVTPTFLSAKVTRDDGRPRTLSDPTPKSPGAISRQTRGGRKPKRSEKEISNISENSGEQPRVRTDLESENRDNWRSNEGAGEGIPIPSSEESRASMMSSSLQMTSPRNVLERMSSLERRSPFLERTASREGVRLRGAGQAGGREGVRGDNDESDDVLVAKGRRSGRSKKRRRRKNEENEVLDEAPETSLRGHVTREGDHVTSHVTPGAVLFDPSTAKSNADDPIPAGVSRLTRTEECDYETEPKLAVVPQEREGERGTALSLEMELALAARDEPANDIGTEGGDQLENFQPDDSAPSITTREKSENYREALTQVLRSRGNPFDVEEEQEDTSTSPTLSPSLPHSSSSSLHPSLSHSVADKNSSSVRQQQQSNTVQHHQNVTNLQSDSKADVERNPRQNSLKSKSNTSSSRRGAASKRKKIEDEFDIITQRDVRALDGRRRANALYSEEGEGEGEGGRERDGGELGYSEVEVSQEKRVYHEPPQRPKQVTEEEERTNDIRIDETMRVVFSIDVYLLDPEKPSPPPPPPQIISADGTSTQQLHQRKKQVSQGSEEEAIRLVQVTTPAGLGQHRPGYVLVTTEAVYLLRKDGTEGIFSREFGARFRDLDHLVIGLGWQSMELVYRETGAEDEGQPLQNCVIITGSEAVTRSLMNSIQAAATQCPGFRRVVPRNRDDESHVEAIERELIKLGSETSMDIVQYSLVNWEQVKGGSPNSSLTQPHTEMASGLLHFKKNSRVGLSSWKQGYFRLMDGTLHQFANETDKVAKVTYSLAGCGGCTRATGEGRQFVLSLSLASSQPLLLATGTEEELTQWQQALCEAVLQVKSSDQYKNPMCTVLLTKEKVHILQEDVSRGLVHHITCCEVTAVEEISVSHHLPLYCTVSYDDGEECRGVWLLCFISEYELGKFESALAELWKEEFQIDLPFSELDDVSIIQRARNTVDLMTSASLRSDSITKGRTEFTYSSTF